MTAARFFKGLAISFVVIFLSDYVWHTMLFGDFYTSKMGSLVMPEPMMVPLIVLEALLAAGVVWFVPHASSSNTEAVGNGAFLGLLTAGTVNLVNHSFMPGWDLALVGVDVLWGVLTLAVAGVLTFMFARK
jgi:uncharacterized membrane protein